LCLKSISCSGQNTLQLPITDINRLLQPREAFIAHAVGWFDTSVGKGKICCAFVSRSASAAGMSIFSPFRPHITQAQNDLHAHTHTHTHIHTGTHTHTPIPETHTETHTEPHTHIHTRTMICDMATLGNLCGDYTPPPRSFIKCLISYMGE